MNSQFCVAMALIGLACAGCARNRPAQETAASVSVLKTDPAGGSPLIVTPVEGVNGRVSSANVNLKFVVLTFPTGQMAGLRQHLDVYRNGLKVGELTVTGPRNEDSIVADIVSGEAREGDEVRDR